MKGLVELVGKAQDLSSGGGAKGTSLKVQERLVRGGRLGWKQQAEIAQRGMMMDLPSPFGAAGHPFFAVHRQGGRDTDRSHHGCRFTSSMNGCRDWLEGPTRRRNGLDLLSLQHCAVPLCSTLLDHEPRVLNPCLTGLGGKGIFGLFFVLYVHPPFGVGLSARGVLSPHARARTHGSD